MKINKVEYLPKSKWIIINGTKYTKRSVLKKQILDVLRMKPDGDIRDNIIKNVQKNLKLNNPVPSTTVFDILKDLKENNIVHKESKKLTKKCGTSHTVWKINKEKKIDVIYSKTI
jgi:hypothetical protein